jgi:PAS domain S-box-containing protein
MRDQTRRHHEDNYLMLDCSKAHARLGWEPLIDLRTALRWTVDWAKSFLAKADMRKVTEDQIARFMATANNRGVDEITVEDKEPQDVPAKKGTPLQEHLFDLVNDSIMTRTMEGMINSWNRSAEALYGWRKEEAIGKVSHDLLQTQFPKPLEEIKSELVQKGRWEGKLLHITRDGSQVPVESRWALDVQGQSGAVVEINKRSDDFSTWADVKRIRQKILNVLLVAMSAPSPELGYVVLVC